jgi:hypothetical protein
MSFLCIPTGTGREGKGKVSKITTSVLRRRTSPAAGIPTPPLSPGGVHLGVKAWSGIAGPVGIHMAQHGCDDISEVRVSPEHGICDGTEGAR